MDKKLLLVIVGILLIIVLIGSVSAGDWTAGLSSQLTSYWPFDETSGTIAYDDFSVRNLQITPDVTLGLSGKDGTSFQYVTGTTRNSSSFLKIEVPFTVGFWMNVTNADTYDTVFTVSNGTRSTQLYFGSETELRFVYAPFGTNVDYSSYFGKWTYIIQVSNISGTFIYLNGELKISNVGNVNITGEKWLIEIGADYASSRIINGKIDEVALWNRTITPSEVADLYDSGTGTFYIPPPTTILNVNLTFPLNNSWISSSSIIFISNWTYSSMNTTTNATYWIYNDTGVFNKTTLTITSAQNGSQLNVNDISTGKYTWDVYTCGLNLTDGIICSWGSTGNFTFNKTYFIENSQTYNGNTTIGSYETFAINLTYDNSYYTSISAKLIYNGIEYTGTKIGTGSNVKFSKSINVPSTAATYTFNWTIIFNDGTNITSATKSQNVSNFGIDDCAVYANQLFNLTLLDEESQLLINGTLQSSSMKITFTVSSSDGTLIFTNYSINYTQINPARLCMQNPLTGSYRLDGIIEYSSTDRFTEFYNFQNYNLNLSNSNITIFLYNLNSTIGTEFKITYKDTNFVPVDGAIMQIQRKYIEEGVYKTTEIPKTGTEGYTIGHLVRNDVIYNIIVMKNGVILGTFNDIVANCQNPALEDCKINLNSYSSSNMPADFSNLDDFSFTLTYARDTRTVSSTFVIPSGVPSVVLLNVTLFDTLGNTSVCSDSVYVAGGTLSCIVPLGFGNQTIIASLFKDNKLVGQSIISLAQKPVEIYGASLIFIAMFAILVIIGIAITDNPMIYGIVFTLGAIFMVAINLIFTPSVIGVGATILWLVVAIILILIKGSERQ